MSEAMPSGLAESEEEVLKKAEAGLEIKPAEVSPAPDEANEPKMAEIEDFLIKNHTYTTPIVAAIDVKRLNRQYKEWMGKVMA